jgi:hypothetical protein
MASVLTAGMMMAAAMPRAGQIAPNRLSNGVEY